MAHFLRTLVATAAVVLFAAAVMGPAATAFAAPASEGDGHGGGGGGDGHGHGNEPANSEHGNSNGDGHGSGNGSGGDGHAGHEGGEGGDSSSVIPKHILSHKWSYHHRKTSPKYWSRLFKSCGGQFQSPIDINTTEAIYWGKAQLELKGYDELPDSMYIVNNGHTVMLVPEKTILPRMKGGDLDGEYELVQAHFHWGSRSSRGSEHFIDKKAFPLELHLVHYNSRYPNIQAALATHDHDALAVLGFLFHVSDEDNGKLDSLIARINQLPTSNGTVNFPKSALFPISDLIDLDTHHGKGIADDFAEKYSEFYRYEGSLTTPTCNEEVEWTVFPRTIPISEHQLHAFRLLTDKLGYTINDNFRPVFPLGGRLLRKYGTEDAPAAASAGGAGDREAASEPSGGGAGDDDGGDQNGKKDATGAGGGRGQNRLDVTNVDFIKHDHDKDHDIFFEPSYYSRPEIKSILEEEERPAPAPKRADSATILKEKLEECQELRRELMRAAENSSPSVYRRGDACAHFVLLFASFAATAIAGSSKFRLV